MCRAADDGEFRPGHANARAPETEQAMRVGLFSDVHGNLQGLRAVLHRLAREGVDRTVCLGDVVGYGGDPEACVELVAQRADACVMGNHDLAILEPALRRGFNPAARAAVDAHAEWLRPEHHAWLRTLPLVEAEGSAAEPSEALFLTHATPGEAAPFTYLLTSRQAGAALGAFRERFAAVGHTHVPVLFEEVAGDAGSCAEMRERSWRAAPPDPADPAAKELGVAEDARAIVNPGSAGQPRDGDPRAACMVLDLASGRVRALRVEYDVPAAQTAIRRRGLPPVLATRLAVGR
ncbi:MAG: metallophosphoesterase [Gemmatimonadota bacterium]